MVARGVGRAARTGACRWSSAEDKDWVNKAYRAARLTAHQAGRRKRR